MKKRKESRLYLYLAMITVIAIAILYLISGTNIYFSGIVRILVFSALGTLAVYIVVSIAVTFYSSPTRKHSCFSCKHYGQYNKVCKRDFHINKYNGHVMGNTQGLEQNSDGLCPYYVNEILDIGRNDKKRR